MTLLIITEADPFVSVPTMRKHLQVEHEGDDAYIASLILAAQDKVQSDTGRGVGRQVLEMQATPCAAGVELPFPPFVSLDQVQYVDTDDALQTMGSDDLTALRAQIVLGRFKRATVRPVAGVWPAMADRPDALRLRFTAGFQASEIAAQRLGHAMLMLVAHWYANRETATTAALSEIPHGAAALIAEARVPFI